MSRAKLLVYAWFPRWPRRGSEAPHSGHQIDSVYLYWNGSGSGPITLTENARGGGGNKVKHLRYMLLTTNALFSAAKKQQLRDMAVART